ncbi:MULTISPECIES: class I SAM-dependent methyltransferase [Streptosporangium]|uniref:SAM-dependent methyltransferase n=1 Tax=Streptosporangium brasiliense TaxID=47480 RepID=A0ABT9RCE3_9ACTN|nr:class I SAM-dependent methyltransferase [Streptosporangium brasiliense]MDP9866527.1 SAM-dependent methyltransferase [Streptosporangium brasiliense]
MPDDYWNHNVHYHPLVLGAVPEGCGEALDIGCGDGLLARKLAGRARHVTGVDRSPEMIRLARERDVPGGEVTFVAADFLDDPRGRFPAGKYDFVSAVAVVHHMDFGAAVTGMARLLAPGGRLVIVGLARNRTASDWLISGAGVPASLVRARRHGGKGHPAGMPMEDPDMSWGQVRDAARRLLPGCRFRRHLLWRYSIVWQRP